MIPKVVGWTCGSVLGVALLIGIFFPSVGADSPTWLEVLALIVYGALFYGVFWSLSLDEGEEDHG